MIICSTHVNTHWWNSAFHIRRRICALGPDCFNTYLLAIRSFLPVPIDTESPTVNLPNNMLCDRDAVPLQGTAVLACRPTASTPGHTCRLTAYTRESLARTAANRKSHRGGGARPGGGPVGLGDAAVVIGGGPQACGCGARWAD